MIVSVLVLVAAGALDGGMPSTIDERARFIAGLAVGAGSVLAPLQEARSWQKHALALDAGWSKLETNRLSLMSAWAAEEVTPAINPKLPLVYLFGGPDAISVDVIYPDAPVYVLAGLERVGSLPVIESLTTAEIEKGLDSMRAAMRTTIDQSFFVTSMVSGDLRRSKLQGVLPLVLLMLARHGDEVLDADTIFLDANGVPSHGEVPRNGVPGLHIRFRRGGGGEARSLYYFAQDVGNDALPSKPGLLLFLKGLGPYNSFFKAASFILHDRHFSKVRTAVLENSESILQDDSGVAYQHLKPEKWKVTFFGEYTPQTGPFSDHWQTDLKAAWDAAPKRPLPFRTGYKHKFGSTMLLAVKRSDLQ